MRVNGLYGHVRRNDARSLALFAGFVVAFQLLAALALLVPLAMFDPDHSLFYGGTGYFTLWMPIVSILGAALFALQMFWHVGVVRRRTDFRFVDESDEARLCRIVEPLTIAAGLPTPYVAVIASPALNAFACGIRRKDAVLVFTRGLIDGLDDEELAAVAAHEISHIVNGDIRLMAATNVCLDTLMLLTHRRKKRNPVGEVIALPMLAIVLPLLVVLVIVVSFLRQVAVDGGRLTRLLIASAREFIADAEAVRLTQNPAALVSALRRIEGRSALPNLAAGQEAMMIDGAKDGATATHPTIADRIEAIISVTGSMALNAPARRDTRPAALRASSGFGRRPASDPAIPVESQGGAMSALTRVSGGDDYNRLGLTRELTIGAALAAMLFIGIHRAEPSEMVAALDPVPTGVFFDMASKALSCQWQGIGWLVGVAEEPTGCGNDFMERIIAKHGGVNRIVGWPGFKSVQETMISKASEDTFRSGRSPAEQLTETRGDHCFQTDRYSVGDRGLHSIHETSGPQSEISFPRYLAFTDAAAERVLAASPAQRDAALLSYFRQRKVLGEVIHRFFGKEGLAAANSHFVEAPNQDAVKILRARSSDPGFTSNLNAMERAELELLVANPTDFVSCVARHEKTDDKTQAGLAGSN